MKKTMLILVMCFCFTVILSPAFAEGEEETLVLDFNRDFGYGGFGGDIQGRFSMKVRSPEDLVRVVYYLDGELVFDGTEPPFTWKFNTASYPEGRHTFNAVGYKADGTEVFAEPFTRFFLSAESAWGNTAGILVPILIVVGIAAIAGIAGPLLLGRHKEHTPGVYGAAGGSICPRCTFPFSRGFLAPNLLVGKLVRCPHCGKWSILPRAPSMALAAAEERLAADGQTEIDVPGEADKLRRMIEDSRFEE